MRTRMFLVLWSAFFVSVPAWADGVVRSTPLVSCEDNPLPGTVKVKCSTAMLIRPDFKNGQAEQWSYREAGREVLYVDDKGVAHAGQGVSADELARFAFAMFQRYEDNMREQMRMYTTITSEEATQIIKLERALDAVKRELQLRDRRLHDAECRLHGCP